MKEVSGKYKKNEVLSQGNISYTGMVDFRYAARIATPGVVNIKSSYGARDHQPGREEEKEFYYLPDPFKDF